MLNYYYYLFNCTWVFTRWQWYYNKTQHNTHHINTAQKTTQTIKDTLHTMITMQIQLQLQLYKLMWMIDSLTNELSWSALTSRRTEYRKPSPTFRVLLYFIRCHMYVFGEPLASNGLLCPFVAAGTCVTEPLPSNGHISHNIFLLPPFSKDWSQAFILAIIIQTLVVQWLRLALSKGPNRADVSPSPSSEDGNRSSFRNVVFLRISVDGQSSKPSNFECYTPWSELFWNYVCSHSALFSLSYRRHC
jgi:hypothetical protein